LGPEKSERDFSNCYQQIIFKTISRKKSSAKSEEKLGRLFQKTTVAQKAKRKEGG